VDNGSEFAGRPVDNWVYQNGVVLDLIRPSRLVQNALIESFKGSLRDEFMNTEVFLDIADASKKLEEWRNDYNYIIQYSPLEGLSTSDFASTL